MRVFRHPSEIDPGKACLAIGVFDGVHLGHQRVIRQTCADARQLQAQAVVVTFDRHPKTVVSPDRVPELIYSLSQKLRAIAALGTDATLLLHFDENLRHLSGEQFIRQLSHDFGSIQGICVGQNFTFGHRRTGNLQLLASLGRQLRFRVRGLAPVSLHRQPVSSTRIRHAVSAGRLDEASRMLGRPYALAGTVVPGDRLGTQLGFPTANLHLDGIVLPPTGVYVVRAQLQSRSLLGLLNIGHRPTLQNPTPTLRAEVHFLQFRHTLYGQELELVLGQKLREERRFASLDELKEQIGRDIARVRQLPQQKN